MDRWKRRRHVKLGGDGTPVMGVVSKANKKDTTGSGLLMEEPKRK